MSVVDFRLFSIIIYERNVSRFRLVLGGSTAAWRQAGPVLARRKGGLVSWVHNLYNKQSSEIVRIDN
jgi:hypothetical protein